jgi:signal transduction histidine kinase
LLATVFAGRSRWENRPVVLRLVVAACAAGYAVAAAALIPRAGPNVTTYAAASTVASALELTAGIGLLAAGALLVVQRGFGSLGALAIAAGVAWFAPGWVGWEDGPPLVRSLGLVAAPFLLPLVIHIVLAAPRGRLMSPARRSAAAAAYAIAGANSAGRALFRDPIEDVGCWSNCTDNVFLLASERELARTLDAVWLRVVVAGGVLLAVVAVWRLARASAPARRSLLPALVPAALFGIAEAAYAVALIRTALEDPEKTAFAVLFHARAGALAALAGGLAWAVAEQRRTRAAVERLADELGAAAAPEALRDALARALGDPGLEVVYWLPGPGRFVDGRGRPVERPASTTTRTATPIVRGDRPVAVVIHDAGGLEAAELERQVGSAARLAIDNARLEAEQLARLEELKRSRARVVRTADSERRRLERNLHDGAQQQLLALSYDLRLAARAAEPGTRSADLLARAVAEADAAIVELRELAHGIYPAILAQAGLGPALESLADGSPLPLEIEVAPDGRLPEPVESAAYVVAAERVEAAARRGATHVRVRLMVEDGRLRMAVRDDGDVFSSIPQGLADRVGALGGSVGIADGALEAEIPCA